MLCMTSLHDTSVTLVTVLEGAGVHALPGLPPVPSLPGCLAPLPQVREGVGGADFRRLPPQAAGAPLDARRTARLR